IDAAPAAAHPSAAPTPVPAAPADAPVPLMDPARTYAEWGPAAEQQVLAVLRSHHYVKGPNVQGFEEAFAADTGTAHAVAVDSCTDALYLTLRAVLDRRPADAREVILPPFTFVATAGAVVNAGGTPVFADVDPKTFNLDPASVAARLTPRTAAVIPVHIFGAPADVPALRAVLPEDVFVLEDAAQAIHATLHGRRAGSLADAGTFSFYPSKNLAAAGDGGVVTTDDPDLAAKVRALRDHGQTRKMYDHDDIGTNSRMDEIQAAILTGKLAHIARWTDARREIAARYDAAFAGTAIETQHVLADASSARHLYTVGLDERDRVLEGLRARGIGCGVYYPHPLHRQSCFARFAPADCPVTDRLAERVLSLPCFPGLTVAEQARAIEALLALLAA
ncbi:MAG: DegT/DnrJ/EryC1/StrS family aminotransferase, partial [Planctomycetota bacterium]|nr:DegT/DnrJ/EryC1/StrS family aminotransferase [Planctomycetota bacterium]